MGALTLIVTAGAMGSSQFEAKFHLGYSAHDPGVSTGFRTLVTWADPGEANGVPKPIQKLVFKLQPDSRIDTRALPACEATDEEVSAEGAAACPAESRLGSGHTEAAFASGLALSTDVTLFNARDQIIVLVTFHGTTTVVTVFRDEVKGNTITVEPVLPPGVSLTRLSLNVEPHSRVVGKRRIAYLRSPSVCPASGTWMARARLTYLDSSTERLKSTSPCS